MIVIFPMLVSKNVNINLVPGMAITLEQYIAAYALDDFLGKSKEFNKFYHYKIKSGKIYEETESNWFDLDPLTRSILEEQSLEEVSRKARKRKKMKHKPGSGPQTPFNPPNFNTGKKQGVQPPPGTKTAGPDYDPIKDAKAAAIRAKSARDQEEFEAKQAASAKKAQATAADQIFSTVKDAAQQLKDLKANRDSTKDGSPPIEKPSFAKATLSAGSLNLEPTWVQVFTKDGHESRLGIKVVPMMIEGFNIKHTISMDMQKYFLTTFISVIGRKVMRLVYRFLDKWTAYGQRPRGDIRHDLFYARTGHDGQPFILLDKNEDIPKLFFAQPQNLLKLWKLSWGNLILADDIQKSVMFCMKKYKGMCSNLTYSMVYGKSKEMAKVFEDMEEARKATSSLFRFNKKISSIGGK